MNELGRLLVIAGTSRGVAIYTRQEGEAADMVPEDQPCEEMAKATYVFRESLTPGQYRKRRADL